MLNSTNGRSISSSDRASSTFVLTGSSTSKEISRIRVLGLARFLIMTCSGEGEKVTLNRNGYNLLVIGASSPNIGSSLAVQHLRINHSHY